MRKPQPRYGNATLEIAMAILCAFIIFLFIVGVMPIWLDAKLAH